MFINIGDGGNREGLNDFLDPQPAWSAVREPSYGHGAPARPRPPRLGLEVAGVLQRERAWLRPAMVVSQRVTRWIGCRGAACSPSQQLFMTPPTLCLKDALPYPTPCACAWPRQCIHRPGARWRACEGARRKAARRAAAAGSSAGARAQARCCCRTARTRCGSGTATRTRRASPPTPSGSCAARRARSCRRSRRAGPALAQQ